MIGTGSFDNPKWRVRYYWGFWHVLQPFSWQLGVINGYEAVEEFDEWVEAMAYATRRKPELRVLS